jgi:archaellum biogenesis protein FlaJ (TadC family)
MPSLNGYGWILAVSSIVMFVASLIGIGIVLVRLPPDYFARTLDERQEYRREHWVWFLARNLLGLLILIAGIVMLFMPGQGLLAILVGVLMIDFPGRRTVVRKIIERRGVMSAANGLRARFGRPAFEHPE